MEFNFSQNEMFLLSLILALLVWNCMLTVPVIKEGFAEETKSATETKPNETSNELEPFIKFDRTKGKEKIIITQPIHFYQGASVEGKLSFRNKDAKGNDFSDPYYMEKIHTDPKNGDRNKLVLHINDDSESFEIVNKHYQGKKLGDPETGKVLFKVSRDNTELNSTKTISSGAVQAKSLHASEGNFGWCYEIGHSKSDSCGVKLRGNSVIVNNDGNNPDKVTIAVPNRTDKDVAPDAKSLIKVNNKPIVGQEMPINTNEIKEINTKLTNIESTLDELEPKLDTLEVYNL